MTTNLSDIEIEAMRKHYANGKFFGIALEDGPASAEHKGS